MSVRDLAASKNVFCQTEKSENNYYFPPNNEPGWFLVQWNGNSVLWAREGQLQMYQPPPPMAIAQAGNVTPINRPPLPPPEFGPKKPEAT